MNNSNNGLGGVELTEAQAWETLGRYFEDYSNSMTYLDEEYQGMRSPSCVCDAIHGLYDQDLLGLEEKSSMLHRMYMEAESRGYGRGQFLWRRDKVGMADRSDFCWKQRARVLERDKAGAEQATGRND